MRKGIQEFYRSWHDANSRILRLTLLDLDGFCQCVEVRSGLVNDFFRADAVCCSKNFGGIQAMFKRPSRVLASDGRRRVDDDTIEVKEYSCASQGLHVYDFWVRRLKVSAA